MGVGSESETYVSPVIKYLMFVFNFLFWLAGTALLGIGLWAFVEKYRFTSGGINDVYDVIFDISIVLIVSGAVIFVVAFTGCVGALRENVCLLKFFSYVLAIIFILEIIGAILAFVFSNQVKNGVTKLIREEGIIRYREDHDLQNFMDWVQKTFECCGVGPNSYKDWSLNPYFNCTPTNPSTERCGVPYSCCVQPNDIEDDYINSMCGYDVQELSTVQARKTVYTTGCVRAMLNKAEANLYILGGVAIGLAVPQLLGIFLARILSNQVEDQKDSWI